ncbi:Crp/Fnr family transcriptional regulator [Sedimentibacter hydroxybenzoicus DSM 7310]|uniref:Crp/Fnr family transcriptional regulator n=1 Tax=Sedimentibacter hydroxybenzoicus DSM 7310 TaxID=1123245 RepID=A0A974BJY8_SEDHY|nr:Crp/Fnr family transcriptional regulator [Sedimentibacter hydroxybenzoicus]NYB74670.1 Crp/Fnr family transcriptional regulator [Sedimentibacter hydroxybenzoicus DSM 7310]
MENIIYLLKSIDMFKCLTTENFKNIFISNYSIKDYPKNYIIYMQNEKCKSLDVILEGTITIQKIDADGNILSINDFTNGDVIGENLLFSTDNKYPMTISTKSDVKILHLDKKLILQLCRTNECFLINFLQSLSSKALFLSNKITSLTMKTLRQCIIEFLLYEHYAQKTNIIKLNMTKKELANKIGVQRTSLSRELNKMRKDNLIDFNNKYIIINDVELLNELHIES